MNPRAARAPLLLPPNPAKVAGDLRRVRQSTASSRIVPRMYRGWLGRPRAATLALLLSLGVLAPASGCARPRAQVQAGVEMYERGAYEGALVRLRDAGAEESRLHARQRVRYLAYRALAHWHVGEKDEARRYLAQARAALAERDADPRWLSAGRRDELDRASLELAQGEPAPAPRSEPPLSTPLDPSTPAAAATDTPAPPAAPSPAATDPAKPSPSPGPTFGPVPGAPPGAPIPPAASPPPADAL